jgi:hypothetical protein
LSAARHEPRTCSSSVGNGGKFSASMSDFFFASASDGSSSRDPPHLPRVNARNTTAATACSRCEHTRHRADWHTARTCDPSCDRCMVDVRARTNTHDALRASRNVAEWKAAGATARGRPAHTPPTHAARGICGAHIRRASLGRSPPAHRAERRGCTSASMHGTADRRYRRCPSPVRSHATRRTAPGW